MHFSGILVFQSSLDLYCFMNRWFQIFLDIRILHLKGLQVIHKIFRNPDKIIFFTMKRAMDFLKDEQIIIHYL